MSELWVSLPYNVWIQITSTLDAMSTNGEVSRVRIEPDGSVSAVKGAVAFRAHPEESDDAPAP